MERPLIEFKLPELGEDIENAVVINIYVNKGDTVDKDDPLVELETDKAALDLPSPASGKIAEVLVSEGDTINIGDVVVKIDDTGKSKTGEGPAEEEEKEEDQKPAKTEDEDTKQKETVETAKKEDSGKTPGPEKDGKETETSADQIRGKEAESVQEEETEDKYTEKDTEEVSLEDKELVPASPSIRKLARDLGIEINKVPGTGRGGRIQESDIKEYAKDLIESKGSKGEPAKTPSGDEYELPDFSRWGEIEKVSMSTVRRITSETLTRAWKIPHVTQHDKADITELDKIRKQYKEQAATAGGSLTITPIIMKIVASALKVFPKFNCSIDVGNNEIIYKKYVNVGFAVDTDRGLLVPNVRNTDKKSILDISVELTDMSERARNKKLKPEEMQGGTFSVSNLGGIGGTYFTPVIYSPEVAILGVSKSYTEPVYKDNGELKPRLIMPLSLSYDHRIIDGAEAIRFLRWVAEALEQPFKVIFEGEAKE